MSIESNTEREISQRCVSSESERKDRTHWCKLHKDHTGKHVCICSRDWSRGGVK